MLVLQESGPPNMLSIRFKGFSTKGVYYLRLTSQDATIDPAEHTAVTCDVESDTKMMCRLPNWGVTRGPATGVTLAIIQVDMGSFADKHFSLVLLYMSSCQYNQPRPRK